MQEYQEFLNKNYADAEKINILELSGTVRNRMMTAGSLKKASGAEQKDVYMSMNPLAAKRHRINRDKEHVGRLKWLYVDLDYYNSCYKDFTKKQITGLLEMDYFGTVIPSPTYIIDSGRGIYLLWKINEHIKAYPRWERMQAYLFDCLKEFGADRKVVSDSARVLRCIGSVNSKCGTRVQILRHQENAYCLTNLLREYVIDIKPSEKMISYARLIAKTLEIEPPDMEDRETVKKFIRENKALAKKPSEKMISYARLIAKTLEIELPDMDDRETVKKFIQENKAPATLFSRIKAGQKQAGRKKTTYLHTEYGMLQARLNDLEKLILKHRDKEGGSREHILFLYRYWQLCTTCDKETSLRLTLQLNEKLQNPLEEKEVLAATRSAEKYYDAGKSFRCSNAYVIDALHITEEEMEELSIFIAHGERTRRKSQRNKKAYLQSLKLQGKLTAEKKVQMRRKSLHKLLLKGRSVHEICQKLQISRATFYTDKKQIELDLAVKREKEEKRRMQYLSYFRALEERSLKISAFVLDMSFRTCCLCSWGPGAAVFLRRFLRYWGSLQLRACSSRLAPLPFPFDTA